MCRATKEELRCSDALTCGCCSALWRCSLVPPGQLPTVLQGWWGRGDDQCAADQGCGTGDAGSRRPANRNTGARHGFDGGRRANEHCGRA